MRPTRACVTLFAAGVLVTVIGRGLGALEMYLLGAMAGVALVVAIVYTASVQLDLEISRRAAPAKLRAGQPARIDLEIHNASRRSTPVLRVTDHVSGSSGAQVSLASVKGRGRSVVAYQLPTRSRGLLEVGPLDISFGDPLALTRSTVTASAASQLLVHAPVLQFGSLKGLVGQEQIGDLAHDRRIRLGGDEFYALRPYVVGDDLRRVNWRATARNDDLMVRTDEKPRTGRTTVVLDRRASAYSTEGFERAVSAALSALIAGWNPEDALRLVTTEPTVITDIHATSELNLVDDRFATLRPNSTTILNPSSTNEPGAQSASTRSSLISALQDISRRSRGGTLVVVTGAPEAELAAAMVGLGRRYRATIVITCEPTPVQNIPRHVRHDGSSDPVSEWRQVLNQPLQAANR